MNERKSEIIQPRVIEIEPGHFKLLGPGEPHPLWGYILGYLDEADPRTAVEQFAAKYISGWRDISSKVEFSSFMDQFTYPGDPPMQRLASYKFRDEMLYLYQSGWVAVIVGDTIQLSRMD